MDESLYESYLDRLPLKDMKLCRFCVRKKRKMQPISTVTMGGGGVNVTELFRKVTCLQLIESDDYPDLICTDCEISLQTTAKHVEAFQEADAFWRIYLYRKDQKNIEDADIKFEDCNYLETSSVDGSEDVVPASAVPPNDSQDVVVVQFSVKALEDGNFVVVDDNKDFKIEMLEEEKVEEAVQQPIVMDAFETSNCETCGKVFRTETLLHKHIEKNHPSMAPLNVMCDNCGEICKTISDLEQHINLYHRQHVCMVCSEEFPSSRNLASHMRRHRKKLYAVNGVYTCTVCNASYADKDEFRKHVRAEHLKKPALKCTHCPATFMGGTRLRKHMVQMHNDLPQLKCDICQKMYHSKGQLTLHMRIHLRNTSYVCDICGHEFKSLNGVNRHRMLHDQPPPVAPNADRRRTANKQKGHLACPLCPSTYMRSAPLREHLKKKHPQDGAAMWEEIAPLMCMKCDEVFSSVTALKEHREHHNKFACNICKQTMTSQESLKYHMGTHSTKDRPHACPLCGATYILKTHLAQHTRRVHTLERPHKCQLCSRAFSENYELGKHMRAVHIQERRFRCDQCDRTFKKKNELNIHNQTHTGVYRYRCEICDKGFGNSTLFLGHNSINHPDLVAEQAEQVEMLAL